MARTLNTKTTESGKNNLILDNTVNIDSINGTIEHKTKTKPTEEDNKNDNNSNEGNTPTDTENDEETKEIKYSDKKCFRCGQKKILNGVCQNCGEIYSNL